MDAGVGLVNGGGIRHDNTRHRSIAHQLSEGGDVLLGTRVEDLHLCIPLKSIDGATDTGNGVAPACSVRNINPVSVACTRSLNIPIVDRVHDTG